MRPIILISLLFICHTLLAKDIFVSPLGNDQNEGTQAKPFASLHRAANEAKNYAGNEAVNIWVEAGTYYLSEPLELGAEFSGTAENPVVFSAHPGAKVRIKGAVKLEKMKWEAYRDGIFVTQIADTLNFDQLFVNGVRQIRARFPNYDYQNPLRGGKGYALVTGGNNRRYDTWFSYNPETFTKKEWENPETGIVHAFQSHNWGNMQYRVKAIDRAENKVLLAEGGWQLQRSHGIGGKGKKASPFFIENIFEELDAPGEWFLDTAANRLYFYPPAGINLTEATVEVPVLKDLIQLKGTIDNPVKNIHFMGFEFTQSAYTFLDSYEPLARGDWAIHRGGAVFMEGAENCRIEDCNFEYLGGNGVFMSGYNRGNSVKNCRFVHTGESAVCFVGLPRAVRTYLTWDDKEILGKDWREMLQAMDTLPGPKTPDYPENCEVENCIMHDFGDVGKQVAAVFISMSHKIRAAHNTIYNCPRAGICINDGTWGGHLIEFNDIWETVRETGEHGPFNSWGRERQWRGSRGKDNEFLKNLTRLDAIETTTVRNNRIANFRQSISAGNWTIDLDDGSSYYDIYNNLNLGSTIKLRDGMARKVHNNITVSAVPLGWHVWPRESQDEVYQNIFVITGAVAGKDNPTRNFIRPIGMPIETPWSTHYDKNLYWNINFPSDFLVTDKLNWEQWQQQGYDGNSVVADPLFVDPAHGNYSVRSNSPALKLGFENFPMDEFGHQMTRIEPFGGEFEQSIRVSMKADKRASEGARIFFTLDGSEPTPFSLEYTGAFQLKNTTTVKAQTFDANGVPVGFMAEAVFTKVEKVDYPSWYSTLLAGEYRGQGKSREQQAREAEVFGAILVNIADDPDLIDATGGYNVGCYIKNIEKGKGKMWLEAGLTNDWVIQKVNGENIGNIDDLKKCLKAFSGRTVSVTAARDYGQKEFKLHVQ